MAQALKAGEKFSLFLIPINHFDLLMIELR
jgi:hypothetical protein